MGIPFYFKSIISKFPEIIRTPPAKCSRLFLDYNCIVHMCAAKVSPQIVDKALLYKKIIQDSLEYIAEITKFVTPSELLYIAVDGTCPRAKMQQQRKRRFMSQWRSSMIGASSQGLWDSNTVTPSTDFMGDLDMALRKFAESRTHLPYKTLISDSTEFGEGEHKIFDYMELHGIDGHADVIYGLDADLILLSMIQDHQILLLREVPEFNIPSLNARQNCFLLLDIQTLKKRVSQELLLNDPSRIHDYVMLCALIGNDFIPPLSYLKIKTDGIELLLTIYKRLSGDATRLVDKSTRGINLHLLTNIIGELANLEESSIQEASNAYYSKRPYNSSIDSYPIHNKFPKVIDVSQKSWRLSYYKHLFQYNDSDVVNKACQHYLEGIAWVFEYYFTKQHNVGWYYPFTYSPTCLDLYNFLIATDSQSIQKVVIRSTRNHSSHDEFLTFISQQYMQLLMVLPPSSKALLPLHLATIMDDIGLGCVHFYPTQFNVSTYLKTYLWECSAILPDIDIQPLLDAYTRVAIQKK